MFKIPNPFVTLALATVIHAQWCQAEPLTIGVTLGMTGSEDKWSAYQRMGIELAVEEMQAEGKDIRVKFEDTQSLPTKAISVFNRLHDVDRVDAVIGDVFSFITAPLVKLADQRGKLLVTPSMPEMYCKDTKGMFFSTASKIRGTTEGFGAFLDQHRGIQSVALVYFQDPGWGFQYRDAWRAILSERGIKIASEFESNDIDQDFKTVLLGILQRKPDAIFVAHHPHNFMTALRQLHKTLPVVFANNVLEIPAANEPLSLVEGVYFVDTLASQIFTERFQRKFKTDPILEPYNGYESFRATVKAFEANPKSPEVALKSLKYEGVSGPIDFSNSCAGNLAQWHLKQFVGEKIHLIK